MVRAAGLGARTIPPSIRWTLSHDSSSWRFSSAIYRNNLHLPPGDTNHPHYPACIKGRSERPLPTVYQKLRSVLKRKLMYTG